MRQCVRSNISSIVKPHRTKPKATPTQSKAPKPKLHAKAKKEELVESSGSEESASESGEEREKPEEKFREGALELWKMMCQGDQMSAFDLTEEQLQSLQVPRPETELFSYDNDTYVFIMIDLATSGVAEVDLSHVGNAIQFISL